MTRSIPGPIAIATSSECMPERQIRIWITRRSIWATTSLAGTCIEGRLFWGNTRTQSTSTSLGCSPSLVEPLRKDEFGTDAEDANLVPLVRDAAVAIREAYQPYALEFKSPPASDTLVTKVLLGTLGCFPACDRYFISGFRRHGFEFSELNSELITTVVRFCGENAGELRRARDDVKGEVGVRYPLMKIVDMCFWKTGEVESGRSTPGA